ncbi:MAG: hypothetical protein JWM52_834 [Candidatus Saccharibacteria bacterium]|nr:hypothetical protein [Candidatus Saccharibacteria bacterium]
MQTAKSLRDAATKEQQKANDLRKEAETHRDKAANYSLTDDPKLPIAESEQAQKADEKATLHDQAANQFIQQASDFESKAIEKERLKQDTQVAMQSQIDRLDAEAKKLRGE